MDRLHRILANVTNAKVSMTDSHAYSHGAALVFETILLAVGATDAQIRQVLDCRPSTDGPPEVDDAQE